MMDLSNADRLVDSRGRLVLSRRSGQRVIIGDGDQRITLTLERAVNGEARLGFQAPPDVPIHREEVALRIAREQAREA